MNRHNTRKVPRSSGIHRAYEKHEHSLKRFIARLLMSNEGVEDVAQQAFLNAFRAEQGRRITQPKSFLFRIARNLIISQIRQERRRPTDYIEDLSPENVIQDTWTAEDVAIAQQSFGIHCEAVDSLSPQVRCAYLMRKVYGLTHKEIADRMGISRSTVEKHLIKGVELCDRFVRDRNTERLNDLETKSRHSKEQG